MPTSYVNVENRYVWTSLHPRYIAPFCCHLCSQTILREGSWLCDYPVVMKNVPGTCDAVLCNAHAYRIAEQVPMQDEKGKFIDDVHLCPSHYEEWLRLGQKPFWETKTW